MHRKIEKKLLLQNKTSVSRPFVLIIFLFLVGVNIMNAQQKKITGLIQDINNEPLLGVNVSVKGANAATISDFDGNYSIKAKPSDILVFKSMGYLTLEVKVAKKQQVNVTLEENTTELDEVVVIGYGTQKVKEVTGAVAQVKAEVLEQTTTSDIGSALQGQMAGVTVTSSSGEPGAESNIVIRGFSSVLEGQNSPLYVVDGIPFDSDPQLSVSEIETIDVLKDAASAAIYGTRAAGGVILITTKQGKEGSMQIRVNSQYGVQNITSGTPLMSAEQSTYIDVLRSTLTTSKTEGGVSVDIHRNDTWFTNNTDISDVILRDLAAIQNHSINVSGGSKNLTYSFNTNYFQQDGVLINSAYKRFNVRSNSKFVKDKWTVTTGLTFKRDEKELPNFGVFNKILEYKAFQPEITLGETEIYNVTDQNLDEASGLGPIRNFSGVARSLNTKEDRESNATSGNIRVDYDLSKGLRFTVRGGGTFSNTKGIRIVPKMNVYNTLGELIPPNPWDISSIRTGVTNYHKLTSEAMVSYHKKLGKHDFKLLGATSAEIAKSAYFQGSKTDNVNADVTVFDGYSGGDLIESLARDNTKTLRSYIGRLQYNYDGKYLFSALVRRDNSSQFSSTYKDSTFPSFSFGWNVSDENFWKSIKPVVNSFKIRASFGTTGNDRFPAYSNTAVIPSGQTYLFGSDVAQNSNLGSTEQVAIGSIQLKYPNENVKWETSVERNLGYDLSFFKNKFTLSADVYVSEKRDLLFGVVNPPSTGVFGNNRQSILNVGNMENRGFELALNYRHQNSSGFKWGTTLTFTKNKNRVTKMPDNNPVIFLDNGYISQRGAKEIITVLKEGYEAGAFFLRETDGVIKNQEELTAYQQINPGAKLGELRYVDQNKDGKIDQNDKVYKGSGVADFTGGLNFNASFKGFDFVMQWYGSYGAEIMNGSKAYAYQSGTHRDIYYSWTSVNTNSNIPVYDGTTRSPSYADGSDYWLEDGSFLRLRNVTLGYSLPKKILSNIGLSKFRIYVKAQNPLTITKYSGYDPEVGNNGLSTSGIDRGTYPVSSQYNAGIEIQL